MAYFNNFCCLKASAPKNIDKSQLARLNDAQFGAIIQFLPYSSIFGYDRKSQIYFFVNGSLTTILILRVCAAT